MLPSEGDETVPRDALTSVAMTTMIVVAIVELHVELVAGAAAWLATWWLLREPGAGHR